MSGSVYIVFAKSGCAYCEDAKALLRDRNIPFDVVMCGSLDDARAKLGVLAPNELKTFPIIVDTGSRRVIGGFAQLRDTLDEPVLKETLGRFSPFPIQYPAIFDMYKRAVASFWTADEIPLAQDGSDFQKLTADEQHFLKMILAFFASSDGIVCENLLKNFSNEVQIAESRLFYGFQSMNESEHALTYALLIEALIKDVEERERLFDAILHVPTVKKKAQWALKWLDPMTRSFAERLVAFACVEGILFSGSFAAIFWVKKYKKGLLPGLSLSNQFISRDEALHCEHAIELYRLLRHPLPAKDVEAIVREAVENEKEFMVEAVPCSLLGMNPDAMCQYIEFVADTLVRDLGYTPIFGASNPFIWMENISLEGKTNFFEARVSEYSRAGVMHKSTGFSLDAEF